MYEVDVFAEESQVYDEHKDELIAKARMQFVLIKGRRIVGTYPTRKEAIRAGYAEFGSPPFLTRQITATPEDEYWASCRIGC